MRKFLLIVFVFALAGCAREQWNKDTITNDCLRDFTKNNEKEKLFTTMQIANLCDCVSDKLLANYKSARESNKDEAGVMQIGKDCAIQVMSK
jgi:hypothetical protein